MQSGKTEEVGNDPLVGTWRLVRWYNVSEDGMETNPLGKEATGYLGYSGDGFMFVHLMAANRTLYAVNDPFGGTQEEDSAAMKSQITYAGSYEYRGFDVVHRVTHASCPNWVGTEQVREVNFKDGRLELSVIGAHLQGRPVTAYVLWERAATG